MLIRCEPWTCTIDGYNMGLNYYASSPVLIPTQVNNHLRLGNEALHEGGAVLQPAYNLQTSASKRPFKYPRPPSLNYLARSAESASSRKRSRDDSDVDSDHDLYQDEREATSTRVAAVEQAMPDSTLGSGMTTVIHTDQPASVIGTSLNSQSSTWVEGSMDEQSARPRLMARKSLRLEEDVGTFAAEGEHHLDIDPIVRKLGIGWKRLSTTQQSAAAGSETFIRKQFDMYNPRLLLHHEGLGIYVVSSEPFSAPGYWQQYWLFREDLKSCRFLCRDENELFQRLANKQQDERGNWVPDIVCEGPERFAKDVSVVEDLPDNSPTKAIFERATTDVDMMMT